MRQHASSATPGGHPPAATTAHTPTRECTMHLSLHTVDALMSKDKGRAHVDVAYTLLPQLLPLMLHDNEEVRGALGTRHCCSAHGRAEQCGAGR